MSGCEWGIFLGVLLGWILLENISKQHFEKFAFNLERTRQRPILLNIKILWKYFKTQLLFKL